MSNAVLIAILTVNLVTLLVFLFFLNRLWQLYVAFKDYITPPEAEKPSEFAKLCDIISGMIGRSVVAQAKALFMGGASGQVRAEKAIEGDIALDMASTNPALGAILTQFPHLQKTIRRNPALADMAIKALYNKLGYGGQQSLPVSSPSNGQSGEQDTQFKL